MAKTIYDVVLENMKKESQKMVDAVKGFSEFGNSSTCDEKYVAHHKKYIAQKKTLLDMGIHQGKYDVFASEIKNAGAVSKEIENGLSKLVNGEILG